MVIPLTLFSLFNILSKLIWYPSTTYTASSFASSCTYTDLTGLISSLLYWVLYQCCCNYAMLKPHFCKFLFPLALKWILNYREFEWFHKTLNSVYWETFVNVSLLLSKCSYRTNMFFLKFLTINNSIFSSTYRFTKKMNKTPLLKLI